MKLKMTARAKSGITRAEVVIVVAVALALAGAVWCVARSDFFGTRGPHLNPEASFRERPRLVPRELVRYKKVLTIPTGLAAAAALAVGPDDRIYVAGDGTVGVWDKAGNPLSAALTGLGAEPRCVAVGKDGSIYLGVGSGVEVYSSAGRHVRALPQCPEEGLVNRIVLHPRGIFVAVHRSTKSGFIVQYDASGELQRVITLAETTLLNRLLDVAATDDGLRVTDPGAVDAGRIRVYDYDGRRKYAWGDYDTTGDLRDFTGCCNPVHLAALPDGRIVAAEKGDQTIVKVYHKDTAEDRGRLESIVAELKGAAGLDLAVDSRQRILVLDTDSSAVFVFERTGN